MTTEMFGAPFGIQAAEDQINQNALSGLKALHTLGEIDKQPAEKRYLEARASEQESLAAGHQVALKAKEDEARLMAEFAARRQLTQGKASQGQLATVQDLDATGSAKPKSQADQLVQYADFLEEKGAPISMTAPLRKEIAGIQEKEAIGYYRSMQGQEQANKIKMQQAQQIGQMAGTAAQSPQAYAAVLGDPRAKQMLPLQHLTGDFATDKPVLEMIRDSGMDTYKRLDLAQREEKNKTTEKLQNAQMSQISARVSVLKARKTILDDDIATRTKNGGKDDPEVVQLKKERMQVDAAAKKAKMLQDYPPLPLDPSAVKEGGQYTGRDGSLLKAAGKDASGKPTFVQLAPPPKSFAPKAKTATAPSAADEEVDETSTDDETGE